MICSRYVIRGEHNIICTFCRSVVREKNKINKNTK